MGHSICDGFYILIFCLSVDATLQLWQAEGERLSGLDELETATTRIRMARPDEHVPSAVADSVVRSEAEFGFREAEYRNIEGNAKMDLDRTRSRLRFLRNLKQEAKVSPSNEKSSSTTKFGECPLCQEFIGEKRSIHMMPCAHKICSDCIAKLCRGSPQLGATATSLNNSPRRRTARVRCPWCRAQNIVQNIVRIATTSSGVSFSLHNAFDKT